MSDFKKLLRIFEEEQPGITRKVIRGYGFVVNRLEILLSGFQFASGEILMDGRKL